MDKIKNEYQLVIIGAGPAGLTASIYASRFKVDNLIIGEAFGGLAFEAHKICNFPSEKEISGVELMNKMQEHAKSLGAQIILEKVTVVKETKDNKFLIVTNNQKEIITRTILLASGTEHRKLGLPEEDNFVGRGVSYCATCDAMFFRGKVVAVIGGSNSAQTASLYLAEVADKVYQIYRGDKLRGETVWIDQVLAHPKIEVIYNTEVKKIEGENKLEKIMLTQAFQGKDELNIDGLFVEIGTAPKQDLTKQLNLSVNQQGYIKIDAGQKTSQAGVWAAGDITDGSNNMRQIITAASEGAIAAEDIFKFLQSQTIT